MPGHHQDIDAYAEAPRNPYGVAPRGVAGLRTPAGSQEEDPSPGHGHDYSALAAAQRRQNFYKHDENYLPNSYNKYNIHSFKHFQALDQQKLERALLEGQPARAEAAARGD